MSKQQIPLKDVPQQTVDVVYGAITFYFSFRWLAAGQMYVDISLADGTVLRQGRACLPQQFLLGELANAPAGVDFYFVDITGNEAPVDYPGVGTRWVLLQVTE